MKVINLATQTGQCTIELGVPIAGIGSIPRIRRAIAITDSNVRRLHGERLCPLESIDIDAAESEKMLHTAEKIYGRLLDLNADRSTTLVGIGGGVTLDITGFVASTYLRGLAFIYAPTTLLAQADAAVGGKNGVNLRGYKNVVGTFAQPERVLCDHSLLATLDADNRRGGFIEIVKHAIIGDERLFCLLEDRAEEALALEAGFMEEILFASLTVKTGIVSRDEKEGGLRRMLNLGHTLGHAVEKVSSLPHGDAVGMGLGFAARFSNLRGKLTDANTRRILGLLERFGIPAVPTGEKEAIKDAVHKDKKRDGSNIHFVIPGKIGQCEVEEISLKELEGAINDLC